MRDLTQGRPFVGVFSSADASGLSEANSRFTLYNAAQTPAAITLAANERVVITDIDLVYSGATAREVTLYDGADTTVDAGEQIFKGTFQQYGGISSHLQVPHYGSYNNSTSSPKGYPKVKTGGAGQIDVTIRGVIVRDGQ